MERTVCPPRGTAGLEGSERPGLFEIAGRVLLFEENGAPLTELIELLEGYYCKPIPRSTCITPDATIRLRVTEYPHEIADAFEQFEISGGGVCYTEGRTCIFDFESGRVIAHSGDPQQIDVLTRRALDLKRAEDLQVINYAISTALRRSGIYELHSAALVEPHSGCGVLFAGASGSGKSTLALQLVANGWRYLTDDVLFLKHEGNAVKAYPLRRAFAVTQTTADASGKRVREAFANVVWFKDSKKPFMPNEVFPATFVSNCEPHAIFFPAVTDEDRSIVKPLTRSETMIHLIKLSPWSCYDPVTGPGHLHALSSLAKQCEGFVLLAGRDVLRDPARATELVNSVLEITSMEVRPRSWKCTTPLLP